MRAQYSRSRALAFTTCSSLRPEYPEPPSSSMPPLLGTWVLRERGRMATSSSSSCLRICHSTELLSLLRWQDRVRRGHHLTFMLPPLGLGNSLPKFIYKSDNYELTRCMSSNLRNILGHFSNGEQKLRSSSEFYRLKTPQHFMKGKFKQMMTFTVKS